MPVATLAIIIVPPAIRTAKAEAASFLCEPALQLRILVIILVPTVT
jgi:hypothetical protein